MNAYYCLARSVTDTTAPLALVRVRFTPHGDLQITILEHVPPTHEGVQALLAQGHAVQCPDEAFTPQTPIAVEDLCEWSREDGMIRQSFIMDFILNGIPYSTGDADLLTAADANLNTPTLDGMELQIPTQEGVLTCTVIPSPAVTLIIGFLKEGQPDTEETYGGCDLNGMLELRQALHRASDVTVHDRLSGPVNACIDWDEAGRLLTLRAAGETVDVHLDDPARAALKEFLTRVLNTLD